MQGVPQGAPFMISGPENPAKNFLEKDSTFSRLGRLSQ
jgi:hypothetical protein